MCLQRWYSMVCPQLGSHFRKDCEVVRNIKHRGAEAIRLVIFMSVHYLQFNVVFIRPKLTSKQTIAIFLAGSLSLRSLSLKILLVLLLLAIVSMYRSEKVCLPM